MARNTRRQGTIKNIVNEKGFGFITPDEGGVEFFFHYTGLRNVTLDELRRGTRVIFSVGNSPKGPRAEEIELA